MNKLIGFILFFCMAIILCACGGSDSTDSTELLIENLQARIETLERENTSLQNDILQLQQQQYTQQEYIPPQLQQYEYEPYDVDVAITDKINHSTVNILGLTDSFIELVASVTNNTDRDIRGIQGLLEIQDMFGVTILAIHWDFTGEIIPVGEIVYFYERGLNVNQHLNDHMRFYNSRFEDLIFVYTIRQIVFFE